MYEIFVERRCVMKKKMILSFIIALLSLMTVRASDKTYQISPMGGGVGSSS